ncbi:MAG: DUF6544 family protein [bacterium]
MADAWETGYVVLSMLSLCGVAAFALIPKLIVKRNLDSIARLWNQLGSESTNVLFSEDLIAGLPEPVQRYFRHAIRPGTLIHDGAVLQIEGRMKLRPDAKFGSFLSRERIQAGRGLLWPAAFHLGPLLILGMDSYLQERGLTRWWLLGVIRIANGEGKVVDESAAGRMAAEMIWLPGMLLPLFGVVWQAMDESEISCKLPIDSCEFTLSFRIDEQGSLRSLRMLRLRMLDDGTAELQPFGMDSDGDFSSEGCTVPGRCRVAWLPDDTERRFEFWQGELKALQYSGRLPVRGRLGSSPEDRLR